LLTETEDGEGSLVQEPNDQKVLHVQGLYNAYMRNQINLQFWDEYSFLSLKKIRRENKRKLQSSNVVITITGNMKPCTRIHQSGVPTL